MSTTSQPLNFIYNISTEDSGNQSNSTSIPDNDIFSFSLAYQMLAILGIISVIITFSGVLNNFLNYSHRKRKNRRNTCEKIERDESSRLLEEQPPGSTKQKIYSIG